MLKDLAPWAVKQAEQSKYRTVGVYAGVLGYGYNTELLARKKLPEPKCWSDLLSDKYKDDVQVADPEFLGHVVHDARHASCSSTARTRASTS